MHEDKFNVDRTKEEQIIKHKRGFCNEPSENDVPAFPAGDTNGTDNTTQKQMINDPAAPRAAQGRVSGWRYPLRSLPLSDIPF